jgi:hypothetical protein
VHGERPLKWIYQSRQHAVCLPSSQGPETPADLSADHLGHSKTGRSEAKRSGSGPSGLDHCVNESFVSRRGFFPEFAGWRGKVPADCSGTLNLARDSRILRCNSLSVWGFGRRRFRETERKNIGRFLLYRVGEQHSPQGESHRSPHQHQTGCVSVEIEPYWLDCPTDQVPP